LLVLLMLKLFFSVLFVLMYVKLVSILFILKLCRSNNVI
jgi:hypothetical protein